MTPSIRGGRRFLWGRRGWMLLAAAAFVLSYGCGDESGPEHRAPSRALAPGWYDFYGTFSDNPEYADGSGTCAIPEPVGCPSVTHFCIYGLQVGEPDGEGIQPIHGCSEKEGDPFYEPDCASRAWNVAVGKVYMMPFVISDWDGGGQVVGFVDSFGGKADAFSETTMVVEQSGGFLPGFKIASWETSLLPSTASSPGTVVLTIPYRNNLKPSPPPGAPPGTYSPPASTTDRAVCCITNPEAGEVTKEASGTPLAAGRARLVTPHSIFRTIFGGLIRVSTDVMSITTWDGTFCRRADPGETCIPEDFTCPALDD